MERWCGKTAIVTGASSGIGADIAEALVKAGMKVIGLARRPELIEANAAKLKHHPGKLYAMKCDMRSEADICDAFQWTTKNVGIVHVLVNNAAILLHTNLINGDAERWRVMLETNVLGLCIAQREACKLMMAHQIAGHIININSVVGQEHLYYSIMGVYTSTKHAVTNITHMLRHELNANNSPIKVTSISPGPVETELVKINEIPQELLETLGISSILESKDISDAVMYALGTPATVNVNEITLRPVELENVAKL